MDSCVHEPRSMVSCRSSPSRWRGRAPRLRAAPLQTWGWPPLAAPGPISLPLSTPRREALQHSSRPQVPGTQLLRTTGCVLFPCWRPEVRSRSPAWDHPVASTELPPEALGEDLPPPLAISGGPRDLGLRPPLSSICFCLPVCLSLSCPTERDPWWHEVPPDCSRVISLSQDR